MTPFEKDVTTCLDVKCHHCGDLCDSEPIFKEELTFCCHGCSVVYTLLSNHNLEHNYYGDADQVVGICPKLNVNFTFLNEPSIADTLLSFKSADRSKIILNLPGIHCVSCVWLLENINRLNSGIIQSRVNYLQKTCSIIFNPQTISLYELVTLLNRIGYSPNISLLNSEENNESTPNRSLYYKLGLAGFAFGNIMLLSFPDYLGLDSGTDFQLLGYINILLSIPVLIYAASDYLRSAWNNLLTLQLGIDIPIALGILIMFGRSVFDILMHTGAGYLDSFSGFVLLLLIGRWFQAFTFDAISFNRDYRSFFPVAVLKFIDGQWEHVLLTKVGKGDKVKILNGQIVPCDGTLNSPKAKFDYSFVTGEEHSNITLMGDPVYAGGKLKGSAVSITVNKTISNSSLTQLWNDDVFINNKYSLSVNLINKVGHYFVILILLLSIATFSYWFRIDFNKAIDATTSVLIIACPCVLALAVPFIYGNMMRILSHHGVFSKNTDSLERVAKIDTIVFDKTGTLTDGSALDIDYVGRKMTAAELSFVGTLTSQSTHPLSKRIYQSISSFAIADISSYEEAIGYGIQGVINDVIVKLGSSEYLFGVLEMSTQTAVLVEINGTYIGRYLFKHQVREGVQSTLSKLSSSYDLHLISGDRRSKDERIKGLFPINSALLFEQNPKDKLNYVKALQNKNRCVMMIGDGLNDAGALKQSDTGIVVSASNDNFTPASDLIISVHALRDLNGILLFIRSGRHLLLGGLVLSILYNSVGLYFAMTGQLAPVVSAILMPISSISIMLYGMFSTWLLSKQVLT